MRKSNNLVFEQCRFEAKTKHDLHSLLQMVSINWTACEIFGRKSKLWIIARPAWAFRARLCSIIICAKSIKHISPLTNIYRSNLRIWAAHIFLWLKLHWDLNFDCCFFVRHQYTTRVRILWWIRDWIWVLLMILDTF